MILQLGLVMKVLGNSVHKGFGIMRGSGSLNTGKKYEYYKENQIR